MRLGIAITALVISSSPARTASTPVPETSIYQLASTWQKDDGEKIHLQDLGGEVRVLALFFTQCNGICPLIVSQIKQAEHALPPRLQGKVGFTLVTLDPEEDSLPALTAYREKMGLSQPEWVLLRGNLDDTRELANLLGVSIGTESDGQIPHTALIVILDRAGRIVGKYPGISDRRAFLRRLQQTVDRNKASTGATTHSREISNSR